MNLWHLKYFYEAAKHLEIKAAATKYRVSNSAISQSIKSLENELGVELLVHRKRFFELTDAGAAFLSKAPDLIEQLENLSQELKKSTSSPAGEFTLSIPRSLLSKEFSLMLLKLKKKHPQLKIKVNIGTAAEIRKMVLEKSVQFGILVDDHRLQEFESIELSKGHFNLVSKSPLANLKTNPLIVTEISKIEVSTLLHSLEKHKIIPKIDMEIVSWTSILDILRKSDQHIGYVPDFLVANELENKKLHLVGSLAAPFKYAIKMIWNKNKQQPLTAKIIQQEFKNI